MVVTCHATGEKAVVHFTPYNKAKERYRELNGSVLDSKGEVNTHFSGIFLNKTTVGPRLNCPLYRGVLNSG